MESNPGNHKLATDSFWHQVEKLVRPANIVIDRPKGKPHPRFPEVIYPLDYGFFEGTNSSDGEGVDVWIGSMPGEKNQIVGLLCTVDLGKRDMELKVLLNCTEDDIQIVLDFMRSHMMGCQLIRRPVQA